MLTPTWLDILPVIVKDYNNTIHSTTDMTPIDASKQDPEIQKILHDLYYKDREKSKPIKSKFKLNDFVRIDRWKKHFEKGYTQRWSSEIFRISKVLQTNPISYQISDSNNELIKGSFSNNELQKTKFSF